MGKIGLKFFLEHGHFLAVILSQREAEGYLKMLAQDTPPKTLRGMDGDQIAWLLDTKKIVGVHTFDPTEMMESQKQTTQQPWPGMYRSGN